MRKQDLHKLSDVLWEIPASYRADMRVPARVYTDERMLDSILGDRSLEQLVNVSTLPGLQRYDINCGVRLLRSDAMLDDVKPLLRKLAHSIAREIPSGVGRGGPLKLHGDDFDR